MTTNINLSELDGSQGFVIKGINPNELFGFSVSNAGDINGDGFDDLVIGGRGYYSYGIPEIGLDTINVPGRVYVVFGDSNVGTSGSIKLSELDGSNGFVINEIEDEIFRSDYLGTSVSNAGDVNGDGIDDIIFSAPYADTYVIFGSNTGFDASFDLTTLNGDNGFVISGDSGYSVSNAGDVNGDGIDDLIVDEPVVDVIGGGIRGGSYVIFGSDSGFNDEINLANLDSNEGFNIEGTDGSSASTFSVSNAEDINGDGIDDLIIGDRSAEEINYYRNGTTYSYNRGESYVVFGDANLGDSGNIKLDRLDGSNGFTIQGLGLNSGFGDSVSSAGDLNGDGFGDIIIGAPNAGSDSNNGDYYSEGEVYVIFGGSEIGSSGSLRLNQLDGGNGLVISGVDSSTGFGRSVSSVGDLNSDSFDDLIIGSPFADVNNGNYSDEGESYIIFGGNDGFAAELDTNDLVDIGSLVITGAKDSNSGYSVGNAGDVNGDGIDDVIIGAPDADPNGNYDAGESYVIFGFDTLASEEFIGTDDDDVLSGTTEDDTLSGLLGADDILGAAGDDLIDGGAGNDTLKGGRGADTILGGIGRDVIRGGAGNDFLRGNFADDLISGNTGSDVLWGEFGNDELRGGKGNDILIGGRGNDNLRGNSGSDRLIGVDTININSDFGIGEIDTLTGGEGDDTYILADENRIFYDDGDDTTSGESDLAIITTLNTNRDTIQLQGSADLYSLDFFTSDGVTTDARLIYDPGTSAIGEAIATLEDVDPNLSVADSVFTFV